MGEEETGKKPDIATFCAGSFWDMEAAFRHVDGVIATSVGYMGGAAPDPSYEEVSTGKTGHSEVVMIAFDPGLVSFGELLDIFFKSHDPCKREQGHYKGTQYDPVIFFHNDRARQMAEEYIDNLQRKGFCQGGVAARLLPASPFHRADECHQQYYEKMGTCYPVLNSREPGDVE